MVRLNPQDVFTPRSATVNSDMYVARPALEKRLSRAIDSTQHIVIFGDSGSGKTWLYKQLFSNRNIPYTLVDLSVAATNGLESAFQYAVDRREWMPTEQKDTTTGQLALGIRAGKETSTTYTLNPNASYFDRAVDNLANQAGDTKFIVLDNLEQVSRNDEIIRKISSYIVRLDNERFAMSKVRFLLVGVTSDMKELVTRYRQAGPVANRLTELPEVESLTIDETDTLLKRGFVSRLDINIYSFEDFSKKIQSWTGRNAQQIHSLGYQVACEAKDSGWHIDEGVLEEAKKLWVEESLTQHISLIENRLNQNETRWKRRNQVLYCLGASEKQAIKANDIDTEVRRLFEHTVEVERLGVDQILADLARGDNPILIRNPTERSFRFAHPKIRLAIRAMLTIDQNGDVGRTM